MARPSIRPQPSDPAAGSGAFLSSSAIVDSDSAVRRNLIVEGSIHAEVPLHAHGVAIGTSGRVRGDIYAAVIRVEGEVIGDLFAEVQVRVCYSASVHGDITSPNVIVEAGSRLKGRVLMHEPMALGTASDPGADDTTMATA